MEERTMTHPERKDDEIRWKIIKRQLGYSDEEITKFRDDPRNQDVISKAETLLNKTIVLEVINSHGCNSKHRVGDKFYFDGAGNLLADRCPKKVCVLALNAATSMIFAVSELVYANVDPNEMRFRRAGCLDVGLQCGGWGNIVMELSVLDEQEA
jgi:uncharacterized repeat protein (TIGR04076 family)